MAITGFETGGSGGGGVPNPTTTLKNLTGGKGMARTPATTKGAARPVSSTAAAASSSNWTCPDGATLVRESNGSGYLVCRWNHNGAEFPAMSAYGSSSPSASTGGGGASTGGGGSSATVQALTSALTGATAGNAGSVGSGEYLPVAADIYARNPETMMADMLERQYGEYGGNALYSQLLPYAEALNVLFLLNNGQDVDSGSKENFLQYAQDYWNTLQTPGGQLNYSGMMNNLNNPVEGSPLHSYLTTGNSEDQAKNYLSLMAGVMQTGFHPLIAQAVMDRLGLEADRYIGASGRMAADPFYTRLDARIPGVTRLVPGR